MSGPVLNWDSTQKSQKQSINIEQSFSIAYQYQRMFHKHTQVDHPKKAQNAPWPGKTGPVKAGAMKVFHFTCQAYDFLRKSHKVLG